MRPAVRIKEKIGQIAYYYLIAKGTCVMLWMGAKPIQFCIQKY